MNEVAGGEAGGGRPPSGFELRIADRAAERGLVAAGRRDELALALSSAVDAAPETVLSGEAGVSAEQAADVVREVSETFVPGYRIVREIGRGGMGVVFEAVQTELKRRVALKVLEASRSADPRFKDRFKREARVLARTNHANIAQVHDAGEAGEQLWIAMEFVEGRDCAQVLEQDGPFSEAMALGVVHDAALGLSHAFSEGIIHRDVKPGNLMLTTTTKDASGGGESAIKVTDLGLAVVTDDTDQRVTQQGAMLGTPIYAAPEQLFAGETDHRSDIYGLGLTLYHLVTDEMPFAGRTMAETIANKRGGTLQDPGKTARVSGGFVKVLDRMTARDPQDRYQTYDALLADTRMVLNGREPTTPRLSAEKSCLDLPDRGGAAAPAAKPTVDETASATPPAPAKRPFPVVPVVIAVVVAALAWALLS